MVIFTPRSRNGLAQSLHRAGAVEDPFSVGELIRREEIDRDAPRAEDDVDLRGFFQSVRSRFFGVNVTGSNLGVLAMRSRRVGVEDAADVPHSGREMKAA